MKSSIHIIICFNPMLNIYIADMIKELKISDYFVIEFYPQQIITNITENNLKRFNSTSTREYLRNIKECIRFIEKKVVPYKEVFFYFSHPFHMLSNYFFFLNNSKYHFVQIPDGIANYYNVTTRSFLSKMLLKKIASFFINIKYSLYSGHLTAVEKNKYEYIITLYEKGLIRNGNVIRKIELSNQTKNADQEKSNNILILGQSYKNYYLYQKTYSKIFEYVISNFKSDSNIFYKNHPNENINQHFKDLLSNYKINILSTQKQVELIAANYNTVISEVSSALFNLKILYGDKIHCIAYLQNVKYLSGRRVNHKRILEIKQQLKSVGVTIIE